MSCPIKYNFVNCSSFTCNNTNCGNCVHTEGLDSETLRKVLSLYMNHCKFLYKTIDDLNNKLKEVGGLNDTN